MAQMVKAVKEDAKINFEIHVGYLHRLQQLLVYITGDKTEKDVELFKQIVESEDKTRLEHWMELTVFLTHFINDIETKAEQTGQIVDIDIDEYTKNVKNMVEKNLKPKKD
jgi:gluconate kinase